MIESVPLARSHHGKPPKSVSAQTYGPGRSIIKNPIKRKIKESTINGNDIFLVSGTLNILVTEDLVIKMKAENFTNLLLEDIEETFEFII